MWVCHCPASLLGLLLLPPQFCPHSCLSPTTNPPIGHQHCWSLMALLLSAETGRSPEPEPVLSSPVMSRTHFTACSWHFQLLTQMYHRHYGQQDWAPRKLVMANSTHSTHSLIIFKALQWWISCTTTVKPGMMGWKTCYCGVGKSPQHQWLWAHVIVAQPSLQEQVEWQWVEYGGSQVVQGRKWGWTLGQVGEVLGSSHTCPYPPFLAQNCPLDLLGLCALLAVDWQETELGP